MAVTIKITKNDGTTSEICVDSHGNEMEEGQK